MAKALGLDTLGHLHLQARTSPTAAVLRVWIDTPRCHELDYVDVPSRCGEVQRRGLSFGLRAQMSGRQLIKSLQCHLWYQLHTDTQNL